MLSRTVGMAKFTAEQGATLAARSALFHSRASVLASHTYSVAEPSKAQMSASVAKGLAVEIAGTPAKHAGAADGAGQWITPGLFLLFTYHLTCLQV